MFEDEHTRGAQGEVRSCASGGHPFGEGEVR